MKNSVQSVLAILALASAVAAGEASATPSLTPAATTVSPSANLFPAEHVQLTDGVLADVADAIQNDTISSIFTFGSTDPSVSKRGLHRCKVMPGDRAWPWDLIWEIFNLLLGNRLVKTTPLAAYCYPDWPEYDAGKCAAITQQWLSSDLQ
jgi:hypothetical protein